MCVVIKYHYSCAYVNTLLAVSCAFVHLVYRLTHIPPFISFLESSYLTFNGRSFTIVLTKITLSIMNTKGMQMNTRVTIQDIADALNLSRNTVSKAINNTGVVAESTRMQILQKAAEMGYKQFSYIDLSGRSLTSMPAACAGMEFALLSTAKLDTRHFASTAIDKIQRELAASKASLTIYFVTLEELSRCVLPGSFDAKRISGIFCCELFDLAYCRMLTSLNIPVVFLDAPFIGSGEALNADIVLMDNTSYARRVVQTATKRGVSRIGFVGDQYHCLSFNERYMAFRSALSYAGFSFDRSMCILSHEYLDDDITPRLQDLDFLTQKLQEMKTLPELFICANDFIAIDLKTALSELGLSVPGDVMLCGYDDSQDSRIITPPLTTVHIHSQTIGYVAATIMLSRLREPTMYHLTVHTQAELIFRGSTRK